MRVPLVSVRSVIRRLITRREDGTMGVALRSVSIGAVVAVLVLGAVDGTSRAIAGGSGKAGAVTGEVLDLACYLAHGRTGAGPGHRKCARECIQKKHLPMALLTDDGDVVLLVPDHANEAPYEELKGHAADTVTVQGKLVERGGVSGVIVSTFEKQ